MTEKRNLFSLGERICEKQNASKHRGEKKKYISGAKRLRTRIILILDDSLPKMKKSGDKMQTKRILGKES